MITNRYEEEERKKKSKEKESTQLLILTINISYKKIACKNRNIYKDNATYCTIAVVTISLSSCLTMCKEDILI